MKNKALSLSVFYCANSLRKDELDLLSERTKDVIINSISLPCSGKVNLLYLLKAIETGSDGVLLVSCKLGECKFLQGNYRARKRIEYVDDLLFETGFGRGHVKYISIEEDTKMDTLQSAINELAKTLSVELLDVQK